MCEKVVFQNRDGCCAIPGSVRQTQKSNEFVFRCYLLSCVCCSPLHPPVPSLRPPAGSSSWPDGPCISVTNHVPGTILGLGGFLARVLLFVWCLVFCVPSVPWLAVCIVCSCEPSHAHKPFHMCVPASMFLRPAYLASPVLFEQAQWHWLISSLKWGMGCGWMLRNFFLDNWNLPSLTKIVFSN